MELERIIYQHIVLDREYQNKAFSQSTSDNQNTMHLYVKKYL